MKNTYYYVVQGEFLNLEAIAPCLHFTNSAIISKYRDFISRSGLKRRHIIFLKGNELIVIIRRNLTNLARNGVFIQRYEVEFDEL